MKIVVCVYKFDLILKCNFASNSQKGFKGRLYGDHYEVSPFLDNALCSDYRLVTFYPQTIIRAHSTTYSQVLPET